MTNEIALVENNPTKLNKLFGFEGRPKPPIPVLKINGADEEEGVTAPKGTFVYDDGDRVLYSKVAIIRVFQQAYQYRLWDNDDKAKTDMSIIAPNFRVEFRSISGKMACGKLPRKAFELLGDNATAMQKYYQDKVKCKLIVFGLLSGTFVDIDTKEQVDLENVLFMWTVGQSGFIDTVNTIKGIERERRAVPQTPIALGLKKEKQGSVTYFKPTFEVMTTSQPMVADRDLAYLTKIKEFIQGTNSYVNGKYEDAVKGKVQNEQFADVSKTIDGTAREVKADDFPDDPLGF